jgi:hypothetical protein
MDKTSKETTMEEAISRIQELTKKYKLNPHILKYFKEGKVYYSYLTALGFLGSIDTISYDPRYEEAVKKFEQKHDGFIVYHAIESKMQCGDMLDLLYVSNSQEQWETERLYEDCIASYTVNFTNPELSEFGDIAVSGFGESGALIRKF